MDLPSSLIKDFAALTSNKEEKEKQGIAYGTVVTNPDGSMFVRLDGSDGQLTPVLKTMDAENGDRVMVVLKNRQATIIGNSTSPASARTATKFMNLTDEGLVVGELDANKNPTGMSALIAPGVYYIVNENGVRVASFSGTEIRLGNGMAVFTTSKITLGNGMAEFSTNNVKLGNGLAEFSTNQINLQNGAVLISANPSEIRLGNQNNSKILLCNDQGSIQVVNGTLYLEGANVVGMRANYNVDNNYRAEVVAKSDTPNVEAALQIFYGGQSSSVIVSKDGISLHTLPGGHATVNGYEILTGTDLVILKKVIVRSSITLYPAGSKEGQNSTNFIEHPVPGLPDGYVWFIVEGPTPGTGEEFTYFDINYNRKTISCGLQNIGSASHEARFSFRYVAIRSSNTQYSSEETVYW